MDTNKDQTVAAQHALAQYNKETEGFQKELDALLAKCAAADRIVFETLFAEGISGTVACHGVGPRPAIIRSISVVVPKHTIRYANRVLALPLIRIAMEWEPIGHKGYEPKMLESEQPFGIIIPIHTANAFSIQHGAGNERMSPEIWRFDFAEAEFKKCAECFSNLRSIAAWLIS